MASSMTEPEDRRPDRGAASPTAESNPAAAETTPARDARLDNAKFLLIGLVVVGHMLGPMRDYGPANVLYYWIYFFHMPAFILISGYLSRSFTTSPRRVEKLILTLAVPYLVFWAVDHAVHALQRGSLPDALSLLQPTYALWFLVALFLWRLSVPVWQRLRWPVAVALVVSVCAATTDLGSGTLAIGRVLSFLPFFVLGLTLRREHLALLDRLWVRVGAVAVMGATALLAVPASQELSTDWLFLSSSLTDRDIDPLLPGLGIRLAFLGIALAMSIAFLALTPKRRTWFTDLGAYTLYVYLGHAALMEPLRMTPWYDVATGPVGTVATLLLAAGLVLLLCSPWVRACLRWAVEPRSTWFLKPLPDTPRPAERESAGSGSRA